MTDLQFYKQPNSGAKNKTKTKPIYESVKLVLKLKLGSKLD